jgi:serine/threonine protein kinase
VAGRLVGKLGKSKWVFKFKFYLITAVMFTLYSQVLRAISPHQNIITLYDCFIAPKTDELYLVFEPMEGNLYQLIQSRKGGGEPFTSGLVASMLFQIISGLDHIHSNGYCHDAMQPDHILVTATGSFDYASITSSNNPSEKDVIVKIGHFVRTRKANDIESRFSTHALRYRAPEILLQSNDHSKPADMWALGTIMAEVLNLYPIFAGRKTASDQLGKMSEVLGDPSSEYGINHSGSPMGGGPWPRGLALAQAMRFQFPEVSSFKLHFFFSDSSDFLRYRHETFILCSTALYRFHLYIVYVTFSNTIPILASRVENV